MEVSNEIKETINSDIGESSREERLRRSTRIKKSPQRIIYDTLGGNDIKNISMRLCNIIKMGISKYEYIMELLYDSEYGSMDNLPPDF